MRHLGVCSGLAVMATLTLALVFAGCNSKPANPLIGSWVLTADNSSAKTCFVQQKVVFTDTSVQTWNAKGATGGPLMYTDYVVQPPNVFLSSMGGPVTYTVNGPNITWYSPYGACVYSRQ